MRFYQYPKCGTCRKAKKFLVDHNLDFEDIDITEKTPTKAELQRMLQFVGGELRKLFNSSGLVYREMGLKDKLPSMSQAEAFELLRSNGKLIKRPFLIGDELGFVGFREQAWRERLK